MGHPCFGQFACTGVIRLVKAAAILTLLLCCGLPAQAGTVSGQVTLAGERFPAGGVLTLTDAGGSRMQVGPDRRGEFSIVLPPGTYRVTYRDAAGGEWTARLRAYPGPARQNIELRRGR